MPRKRGGSSIKKKGKGREEIYMKLMSLERVGREGMKWMGALGGKDLVHPANNEKKLKDLNHLWALLRGDQYKRKEGDRNKTPF